MLTLKSRIKAGFCYLSYDLAFVSGVLLFTVLGWTHRRHHYICAWAPKREAQVIRDAIDYLIKMDGDPFFSLTPKWQPTFCYSSTTMMGRVYKIFVINRAVLAWGGDGVATYILYGLLTLQMFEKVGWPHISREILDETNRLVCKEVSEWSRRHGIACELCDHYFNVSIGGAKP